ncbi:MAG: hypothetical protein ABJH98_10730 [Reichenbachiella sp.]|uniref:glycoside hydrolase family 113 n=1 Tax=Reichenbachiella sp. TaxID=2184521 RepID=UPI003298F1E8
MKLQLYLLVCFWSCTNAQESKEEKINGLCLVAPPYEIQTEHYKPIINTGANWVAVIPYAFCSPTKPKVTYDHPRQWQGETTEGVKLAIDLAHQSNLKVMLKPHLWVSGHGWAGDLDFDNNEDLELWKTSYTQYILHFASVAQDLKVEMISIGTEIRQMATKHPTYWIELIQQIRTIYEGHLTYSANWDNYENITFWNELDFIGIDAYFPMSESHTPSRKELIEKNQKTKLVIEKFAISHLKKVLFTEYGFRSVDYCAGGHWKNELISAGPNLKGQANAYEAIFKTYWHEEWFAGGFAWKWHYKHAEAGGTNDTAFTPQNKPAEKILRIQYSKN